MELCNAFYFVNKGKKSWEYKGRIFISKAVLLLCQCKKSRDGDLMQFFVHDKKKTLTDEEIERELAEARAHRMEMPEYVFDCHTLKGKKAGKTKAQFFLDEERALVNRQESLFDFVELMK